MKENEFLIMRHSYDDHSYIDGKNDTALTTNGIQIAKDAAQEIVHKLDDRFVVIRYSSKIRARQTAEILSDLLQKRGINFICVEDKCLTELYQGKLNFCNMKHEDKVDFLQSCWDDFEYQREHGNLKHRFGEFKDRDIVIDFGENHAEWSARIGRAVLNIINEIESKHQVIGVTHRGASFAIQNIVKMANGLLQMDQVESYKTIRVKYCQDYLLSIDNFQLAKKRINDFVEERSLS